MKKLSDEHFDKLLKHKAESFNYDFDDTAWDKMEQKLRKRDRIIFIRNSSFVLALLMFIGGAYLLSDKTSEEIVPKQLAKSKSLPKEEKTSSGIQRTPLENTASLPNNITLKPVPSLKLNIPQNQYRLTGVKQESKKTYIESTPGYKDQKAISPQTDSALTAILNLTVVDNNPEVTHTNDSSSVSPITKKTSKRKPQAFSVTALAGPEFSSINSIAGRKGTLTIGFLVNASVSKKFMLSTGLKYGLKNYQASAYTYQLENPSRANNIAGIDASCNILEIPLQLSYQVFDNKSSKIQISSGLSSYLMLTERYNFRYKPESGYKGYMLTKKNANQHYLSVLSLSAAYQIKPKSSSILWAIEPYIKLPLGGVGEGNVKLKSSGISLNLTYDLSKKIK